MPSSSSQLLKLALIPAMSLFLMLPSSGLAAGLLEQSFWKVDKREHYVVTGAITASSYLLLRNMSYNRWESLVTSVALGMLIGTAKEIHDRNVDPDDIKADAAGALTAGGFFFTIDLIAF